MHGLEWGHRWWTRKETPGHEAHGGCRLGLRAPLVFARAGGPGSCGEWGRRPIFVRVLIASTLVI